jgi:hypothetical protein
MEEWSIGNNFGRENRLDSFVGELGFDTLVDKE